MRHLKKLALFAACAFSMTISTAGAVDALPMNLQQGIQNIIDSAKTGANIGVIIRDNQTGRVLYANRADYLFAPASTQKLLTATAALMYLGPNYQIHTQLLTNGHVWNHVLNGDLFLRFSGDPLLKVQQLFAMVSRLKDLGIRQINGHVYIDNSEYNSVPYAPGWMWDDLTYGYAAPLTATIIDRNNFLVQLTPTSVNNSPKVSTFLPAGVVSFNNEVRTTSNYDRDCPLTIYSDSTSTYQLDGCINRSWGTQGRVLALRDPVTYAELLMKKALAANNITYNGNVDAGVAGAHATLLVDLPSLPVALLVKELLKKSDNVTTNSLLKKLGETYFHTQGTWQNGLRALKIILAPTGINFNANLVNDGSGLSRYNLISPRQMSNLLFYANHNAKIHDALLDALPIAGKDGTLAWRMRNPSTIGRIRAKTGTMTGVSALAGYIDTYHLGTLDFVIVTNNFIGKPHPYARLEDRICTLLTNYRG